MTWARTLPLAGLALVALSSALQIACAGDDDDALTHDPLGAYDGYPSEGACDLAAPTSRWSPPQRLHQNACTAAQIDSIIASFSGVGTVSDPNAFAACNACWLSASSDLSHGAIVEANGAAVPNRAGCIAYLTNDFGSHGCAAAVQKADLCAELACARCQLEPIETCLARARATVCAPAIAAASCADALTAPGRPAEACNLPQDGTGIRKAIELFCGP